MGFTHGWQWFSPVTHKHNGIQTIRFNFSLKGLMKGLNKLRLYQMSMYLRPWIPKHAWAYSSIVASRFRCKLKNLEFQTNEGSLTWYAPTATPLTPYFNPLHQPKTPIFTKKLSPKVLFFHTVQNFGNCSLKDPKSAGKKVPKCPLFLWLLSLKDPQFFALHASLRGMLFPQTQSEAGKCCILETELCNLVNTFRCKFNKGDENKISVLQAQLTQLLWKNFIGGQGWYIGHHTLVKHGRGYILQPSSVWFCTSWFSKQMPSVPEAESRGILSVRCNAGPAEGPGKILKYRSNLRLYPVDFGNKLCILIFIILSIYLTKLFWPHHLLLKTFWSPPLLATQNFFGPPPFCPAPPPRYLWTLSKLLRCAPFFRPVYSSLLSDEFCRLVKQRSWIQEHILRYFDWILTSHNL